jgi:hypothetical protein
MSTRYAREVSRRAAEIVANAESLDEFAVPHQGHEAGQCVDCDAYGHLFRRVELGESLHKMRRAFAGHAGERDPLDPPLLGSWSFEFPTRTDCERAWEDAFRKDLGLVLSGTLKNRGPRFLEIRTSVGYDEVESVRERMAEWAEGFAGTVVEEEIVLKD